MTEIRLASVADIPEIQRLASEAWHAAYGGFVPDRAIDGMLGEWYSDDPRTAVLSSIYVSPGRWGEGVGTALFEAVAGRLRERGFGRVRATVLAANDVGRAFYETRGFERIAAHEEELGGDSYDALVVQRTL